MKILTFLIIAVALGVAFYFIRKALLGLYKTSLENFLNTLDFKNFFERYNNSISEKEKEQVLYEAKREILKYSK